MDNKIEYQIYFEITENLKIVSDSIAKYSKAVEYATSACKSLENTATINLKNVAKEGLQYIDTLLGIANSIKNLRLVSYATTMAQSVLNNTITFGQRALYTYQMQVLLARSAIASTTGATKAMNLAIAASPYLIAAAAVVTLGVAIYKFVSSNSEAAQSQKRLNEAMNDMNKEIAVEQVKLDTLFEPLNRAKEGTDEWNRAKDRIVSQYGDYLNKMGIEIKDVNTAREAYNRLSQSILNTARSRALEATTSKAAESYADNEVKGLKKIREVLLREAKNGGEINYSEAGKAFGQIKAAIRSGKDIPAEAKAILGKFQKTWRDRDGNVYENGVAFSINNQIKKIRSSRSAYENEISEANALFGGMAGFKPSEKKGGALDDKSKRKSLTLSDIGTQISELKKKQQTASDAEGRNIQQQINELEELKKAKEQAMGITLENKGESPAKNSIADIEHQLSKEKNKQANAPVEMGVQIQTKIENLEEQLAKAKMIAQFGEPVMVPLTFQTDGKALEALSQFQKKMENGAKDTDITPQLELPKTLPQLTEGFNSYANSVQSTADNLYMTQDGLGMTASLMSNLSGVVGEGAAGWLGYGANILSSVAQAIPAIAQVIGGNIAQAFAGATAQSQTVPFPLNIIALAASLAAVGAAVAQIPAFAAGGIAFGPTFGLFGEYSGAKNNPEVVAPLNRLRSLLQPVGATGGEVNFRIRDRYLEGVLQRRNNRVRRTR